MSQLVNDLLDQYLFGNNNHVSEEILELKKLKEELSEIKEAVFKLDEIEKRIERLEEKLNHKQEIKETEESLHLIRELREIVFEDLQDYNKFKANCMRIGREPADAVKAGLAAWAAEKGISYPQAVKLFFKAFPELKEKLEGRL